MVVYMLCYEKHEFLYLVDMGAVEKYLSATEVLWYSRVADPH